ncbi:hypothetical protein [Pectobacterium polaris]|uniref:hypothetical protein n=1 Tax=Pectobacterium polaris TaxID=2042057 RepID=UPI0032F0686E
MTERVVAISGKTVEVSAPGGDLPVATMETAGVVKRGVAVPDPSSAYQVDEVLLQLLNSLRRAGIISG